ncbi:lasso peptide biosynthesis B2 protein [Streptomyces sp. TP-A0874]|uniref:lasso peptide biosynthesis B2 protein n=1 Tax=Streptomyces sp. TP-A0874 TaxID=549819 RepID=UPI00085293FB|nr:lasso peptide biosynthesis B2 protein [Streptomyces sp. TP-A0874]
MSFTVALPPRTSLTRREHALARACSLVATRLPPSARRVEHAVHWAQRSADRPSTLAETEAAVLAVCTASIRLAGITACLAALLYCRAHGHSPSLVLEMRPGTAQVHAWLEADRQPAAEPTDPRLLYVPITRYQFQEADPL